MSQSTAVVVHPRWVNMLRSTIDVNMKQSKDSISYAISTLDDGVTSAANISPSPRVRFVVHRGFVNERRAREDLSWSTNEPLDKNGESLFSNSMMVTTDVRAPKALQTSSNPAGGVLELAWWLAPTQEQFRIRGRSYIYAKAGHPINQHFPFERLAPVQANGQPFDWEQERVRIWRKMSPALRASYCRPTPGTPLHRDGQGDIDPRTFPSTLPTDLDAKTDEEKAFIQEALTNMSLLVIEPFDVDWCNLGAEPNERIQWKKNENGEWSQINVVP